ncbi:MAG: tetratricopeptide repeat protein [Solimonas sp.]
MTRCRNSLLAVSLCLLLGACASEGPAPVARKAAPKAATAAKIDDGKGDLQARYVAALQLMQQGRRDEAMIALQVLSSDFPQYSGPWTNLGLLHAQLKQRDKAQAAFAKAVQINPRNAVALDGLGLLYRESGDAARAEQQYLKAIAAQPDYAQAHYNLAILYDLALRRPQEALAQYRLYQKLAGDDANLMVGVWIRELEARSGTTLAAAGGIAAGAQK